MIASYRARKHHWEMELIVARRRRKMNRFVFKRSSISDNRCVQICLEELRKLKKEGMNHVN